MGGIKVKILNYSSISVIVYKLINKLPLPELIRYDLECFFLRRQSKTYIYKFATDVLMYKNLLPKNANISVNWKERVKQSKWSFYPSPDQRVE